MRPFTATAIALGSLCACTVVPGADTAQVAPPVDDVQGSWRVTQVELYEADGSAVSLDEVWTGWSATAEVGAHLAATVRWNDGSETEFHLAEQAANGSYDLDGSLMDMSCVVQGELFDCTDSGWTDWDTVGPLTYEGLERPFASITMIR